MSSRSKIEWTDTTWNPVTGCSKVSPGCRNCYAERTWARLSAPRKKPNIYTGRQFTDVQCHPERLGQPLQWKTPRRIFVNSMSDLFHEKIPFTYIASVFSIMSCTTRHRYQVLTKRPERMLEFFNWALNGMEQTAFCADDRIVDCWPEHVPWDGYDNCGPIFPYENVWLGVSIEDQETANERIPLLLDTPAAVRWLSIEPLLALVDLCRPMELLQQFPTEPNIHWIVVGGESGPKARPMHPDWVRSLRDQCQRSGVPFFFKQYGEWGPNTPKNYCRISRNRYSHESITFMPDGALYNSREPEALNHILMETMYRAGKRKAGRILDGRTWDEYPI